MDGWKSMLRYSLGQSLTGTHRRSARMGELNSKSSPAFLRSVNPHTDAVSEANPKIAPAATNYHPRVEVLLPSTSVAPAKASPNSPAIIPASTAIQLTEVLYIEPIPPLMTKSIH
jgi:hypothetical protein